HPRRAVSLNAVSLRGSIRVTNVPRQPGAGAARIEGVRMASPDVTDAATFDRLESGGAWQRGRGLMRGLAFADPEVAGQVRRAASELGLLVESAGPEDEVVKLMPPLTIAEQELEQGLALLAEAVQTVC